MKKITVLLLAGILSTVRASELRMEGGKLDLNGTISAEAVSVGGNAVMQGSGTVEGSGNIAGTIAPGDGSATSVEAISFTGDLVFQEGSRFECYASTHTNLDKIKAGGTVTGSSDVNLTRAAEAVPLYQAIVEGGASSDYASFDASPANWSLSSASGDLLVSETTGDSDFDTLPDKWEYDYFDNRLAAEQNGDDDDDLFFNWQERVAGTDPTDDASKLAMQAVGNRSKTNLVISWQSVDGKLYSVYRRTNLVTGTKEKLAENIAATPPVNSFTNTVTEWERYYYRVEVQQ